MAIDLTLLSRQQLDQFFHVQGIIARQGVDAAKVRALRLYYDGEHPTLLTDRQEEFIGKMLTEGEFQFAHNLVKTTIDTIRERLNVSGFGVNGKAIDNKEDNGPEAQLAALFWAWWEENRYDAQQIRLHRRALRDGKSYVMVDYDSANSRPRFTLLSVDDGTTGITCHRNPEMPDEIMYMCKYWYTFDLTKPGTTGKERKTVYLPHEIRKYIRGGSEYGWIPTMDPEDGGMWPIPWRDRQGDPLGVPIIEFENPGGSEVAQIIGLQNMLNKAWLDLIATADMHGFPILAIEDGSPEGYAAANTNNQQDDDIEGDDELFMAPNRILNLFGAKAHRIETGDLSQLINVIWSIVTAMAGVTRTPQHYYRAAVGSDALSGEAIKALEGPLVKRAEERQLIFGQSWADVMAMAYKLERTFGNASIPDLPKLKVHTIWDNAETRDEKSDAEMGEIYKRLGIPDEEIWLKLGFSPQQCAKFKTMLRTDQAAQTQAVVSAIQSAQAKQAAQPTGNAPVAARANGNGANGNGVVA